jgi:hypothetical protein
MLPARAEARTVMHRGIFFSLVLSTCLAATALAVVARAQPAPPAKAPDTKAPDTRSPPPPMVFYVAKGEPGACGPGCAEWIAAEGFIDGNAEPRLWELLRKIGNDRKPPVYFQSNGGSLIAGFQLGRLLRARGFTTGVGRTVPATCDRRNPADAACDTLKRSGRELAAELDTRSGACASSCVYAVLGGATRDIGAGAKLGVHDTSMPPTIRSFDESGRLVDRPLQLSAEKVRTALAAGQEAIATYLKLMGISPDLLVAAHAVSADTVHVLTRAQIVAFGIDRRETVESTWSLVDNAPGVSAVKAIEARDGAAFRKAVLTLTCRDKTTVRLQYMHETGEAAESASGLRVTAGGRSVPLARLEGAAHGADRARLETLGAELPLAALGTAAFVIETDAAPGKSSDGAEAPSGRLAVQGAAPALAALTRRCASGAQ